MRLNTAAFILLILFATAGLGYQAWHLGMTADEPSHLAAAYAWWSGYDVLTPSDTPPLMRIICGWVPHAMGIPVRKDTESWRLRSAYQIGADTVTALEPDRARLFLFFMRLPFIAFPLLIAFLVWRWGGRIFGAAVGLLLAACALLEPTVLGHGALIKSDVPAAFGALWFAYAAWRYWEGPAWRTFTWMTAAAVLATLIKFTLLPLAGVAFALALIRGPRRAAAFLIPIVFYVATLAAYQFQAAPVPEKDVAGFRYAGVPRLLVPAAKVAAKLPWPEQYVKGLLFILSAARGEGFTGYMLGHKISGRVPAYYPLAWAVKFPIALQALMAAGLLALALRIWEKKAGAADAFIWGPAAFFFGTAVLSSFHIGFRHVLPALPFFILGGGFALSRWWSARAARVAIAAGLCWLAGSSLRVYPQGISYFNEWIGGPENGWKYLADSNLDWGQNIPELAEVMERRSITSIKLFLFGLDPPGRYLKPGTWEPQLWPFAPGIVKERRLRPEPGYYAISANPLTGFTAPPGYEDYLADFRERKPIDRAGYGILIYLVE